MVRKSHSVSNFSLKSNSHNDSLLTSTTQATSPGIEEHLDRASKALAKLKEKEEVVNGSLRNEFIERIRIKKELGLLLPKHFLLSSP